MARLGDNLPALGEFAAGVRNPSLMAGAAAPAILALAAVGLDWAWRGLSVRLSVGVEPGRNGSGWRRQARLSARWILLLPLLLSLGDVRAFARTWTQTSRQPTAELEPVLAALTTPDLQWVLTPFGEQFWLSMSIPHGIKTSTATLPWHWDGHPDPAPVLEGARVGEPEGTVLKTTAAGVAVYLASDPARQYASILHEDGSRSSCFAQGIGGNISVRCDAARAGRLEVKENSRDGWRATVNGRTVEAGSSDQWIGVDVPAGPVSVTLRYRPWDVAVGVALAILGLFVALVMAIWGERPLPRSLARLRLTNRSRDPGNPNASGPA
jgi:hypothetical protein